MISLPNKYNPKNVEHTLNFCTSVQKSTSFSRLSPFIETKRRNCTDVTGFNKALRKVMISFEEDTHLLSNNWNIQNVFTHKWQKRYL